MPLLLDLFCGAGGAAMGYHRAGFDVVGVDIEPQPNYPFEFHQADALEFPIVGFDAVHASPPCQGYTTMNNRRIADGTLQKITPKLIGASRVRLVTSGLTYVIENVAGAKRFLEEPFRLTGEMFGLRVHRARLFESNISIQVPPNAGRQRNPVAVYGKNDGRLLWRRVDGTEHHVADFETAQQGLGIDWMTWREMCESIPPAYTEHIGKQLLAVIAAKAA